MGPILLCRTAGVASAGGAGQSRFHRSFGNFLDETSNLADLILPDHSYLESWMDDVPESGTADAVLSIAPPVVLPLHETRALPDVLLDVSRHVGGEASKALPWKSYEEMLQATFTPLRHSVGSIAADTDDEFWGKLKEQGGWWSSNRVAPPKSSPPAASFAPVKSEDPSGMGRPRSTRFSSFPMCRNSFSTAPTRTCPGCRSCRKFFPPRSGAAGWRSIRKRRRVWPSGKATWSKYRRSTEWFALQRCCHRVSHRTSLPCRAGQGHEAYGRYATGRGANPVHVLAPQMATATGSLAWASTRVKVAPAGPGD